MSIATIFRRSAVIVALTKVGNEVDDDHEQDYSEFGWVPASGTIFTVCLDGCPPLGILTVWDLYPDFSASTENFLTVSE